MIFRNKNLTLKLVRTSEYEKPIVTPVGVIKERYIADHYNACTAAYKTQGNFVSVATTDSRMQEVLQRTHDMTPTGVRIISRLAYVENYKVSKDVWAEIVEAHAKAPASTAAKPVGDHSAGNVLLAARPHRCLRISKGCQ